MFPFTDLGHIGCMPTLAHVCLTLLSTVDKSEMQLPQRIRNMGIPAQKKSVRLPHGPEAMSAFAFAPRPATAAVTGNCVAHSYHKFPKEPAAAAGHLAPTKTHRCRLKGKKGPSRAFPSSPRPRRLCSTSQIVLIPLLGDVHQVSLQNF